MKVLMLSEYFTPYDFGGSEWSTYYLAHGLAKSGVKVTVLTPNYGKAPQKESHDGFEIKRFPFYKKIENRKQLTPFWQNNTIWNLWTSIVVIKTCLEGGFDIVHVQGKYFLPAAIAAKVILGKKIVITLRDYIIICPLGICLLKGNKSCSLAEYFSKDLKEYMALYMSQRSPIASVIQLVAATRAKLISIIHKFLLKFVDAKVAISDIEKEIYGRNNVDKMKVIGNSFEFSFVNYSKGENLVVFAGRLTPGKGPDVLIESLPKVIKKYPRLNFKIFGEGFLRPKLEKSAEDLGVKKNVKFVGRVSHDDFLKSLAKASLSVVPSVWPEPFSRVALESLVLGTPVVVTERTGIVKWIKDKKWGRVTKAQKDEIANGIIYALDNRKVLINNLVKDRKQIEKIFSQDVYRSYQEVYKELLK